MGKLNKIIICLFTYMSFLMFTSVIAKAEAYSEIIYFSTNESIIDGKTGRIEFSAKIRVTSDIETKNQYLQIFEDNTSSNYFIKSIVQVDKAKSGSKIWFRDEKQEATDTVEINVTGTLIFNWEKMKRNSKMMIRIGGVYIENGNESRKIGNIDVDLGKNIEIISTLKVNVKEHMNFGTVIAGQKADTENSTGTPARVEIEGVAERNVKIIIPNEAILKNENGKELIAELRFGNGEKGSREKNYQVTEKKLIQKNREKNIGTIEVEINGRLSTNKNDRGNYKGAFIVRVEYED